MDIQSSTSVPLKILPEALENTLSSSLNIQETDKSEDFSVWDLKLDEGVNVNTKQFNAHVKKCPTFPCKLLQLSSSDEEEDSNSSLEKPLCEVHPQQPFSRSISLPTPNRLASAMKGSREKRGLEVVKLKVKWAPDVYDPEPNSLSHTIKGKKQQKSKSSRNGKNEKKGKKGQKSSSNRGGSGSKKQYSKYVGSSLISYTKKMDARDNPLSVR